MEGHKAFSTVERHAVYRLGEEARERTRAKLQAADTEKGVQRAPAGQRNISLYFICQKTEVSREVMRAFERPRDSFSHVEVHSMGYSHGSLLRAAFTGATVRFFSTYDLSQLLAFQ